MENIAINQQYENLMHQISIYRNFVDDLANEKIKEFAPPFLEYDISEIDIVTYLNKFFSEYIKRVESLPNLNLVDHIIKIYIEKAREYQNLPPLKSFPEFNLIRDLNKITITIIKVLQLYLIGSPALAFEEMSKMLQDNDMHLCNLLPQLETYLLHFFRIRKGKYDNKLDLFHTPFEKRYLCASYRFSILGLPALYCAETLNTCILETRIEEECELSAIRFQMKSGSNQIKKIVDLSLPDKKELNIWEQYSLILFYPLIVACGLKVKKETAPFKPEYIVPQVFYQAIRDFGSDFMGIAYTSTRYEKPDFKDYKQRNYVFFVRDSDQETGYSHKLGNHIDSTQPISFKFNNYTDLERIQRDLIELPFFKLF